MRLSNPAIEFARVQRLRAFAVGRLLQLHQHPNRWHLQYYRPQLQQPQLPQRQECAIALSYAVSAILHAASGFIITLNSKTENLKAKPRWVGRVEAKFVSAMLDASITFDYPSITWSNHPRM